MRAFLLEKVKAEIKKKKLVFPHAVDALNGKIFRGENYRQLPYLVLDYPKHFSKESVLAFRTMLWWGNFFSCTLHLQGKALDERRSSLIQNWRSFRKKDICFFSSCSLSIKEICIVKCP